MFKKPAVFNWSGGKDSTLALHHILAHGEYDVLYLLTTVNHHHDRVSMHGVRASLLYEQVERLNIPLIEIRLPETPDMETYEQELFIHLDKLKAEGIEYSIFGDIFLEDLKAYRVNQLAKIGLNAVFPLWKRDSLDVVTEFIKLGYQTVVVCAQDGLQDFCGRIIDEAFLNDLPKDIDPCGENGEFHTFVFNGPIFSNNVNFTLGEKIYRTFPNPSGNKDTAGYWYVDLLPAVV